MSVRIGVDLGGTKIEAAALDENHRIVARERRPTDRQDYAALIEALAGLIEQIERQIGRQGSIGIGIPGTISLESGRIKNAYAIPLNGRPFVEDMSARLGRPVRVANDANCFALSEAIDGAGKGARTMFGVILGTGVGGGIVLDGALMLGANAIAGEWGHNPLPRPMDGERPGHPCDCGRLGCIETFLSGGGLTRDYQQATGETLPARTIAERALRGDGQAEKSLARYAERLARALASVINLLDPEIIVLGGGLSNIAALYQRVPALWGRHVFSDSVRTRLLPPHHGDSSGVRGAAWLWPA
jgi:fructokinase